MIMAKAPIPGEVKTRLTPVLSPEGAAELSRCFFLDTLELAQSMPDCEVVLAYSPDDLLEVFPMGGLKVDECISQGEGDLGQRMRHVFDTLFDLGYTKVILVGTDLPTVPLRYLQEAFSYLDYHPVVLGPSLDGGYYLIGLQSMIPEIFEGIDWGTNQVFSQTIEQMECVKVEWARLLPWYDVDTLEDLDFLIAHLDLLQNCAEERLPGNTIAFLERGGYLPACSEDLKVGDG